MIFYLIKNNKCKNPKWFNKIEKKVNRFHNYLSGDIIPSEYIVFFSNLILGKWLENKKIFIIAAVYLKYPSKIVDKKRAKRTHTSD